MKSNLYQSNECRERVESVPFAREVYRTENFHPPGEELLEAIASLRAEVRSEVRALRSVMSRPKVDVDINSEIGALRANIDELLTSNRGDAFSALVRSRGIEGAAAVALGRLGKATGKDKGRGAEERLAEAIASLVSVVPWPVANAGRSLVALVGPAGVGKTTTAAKLGARMRRARRSVMFVSCDGYRVGATDQLRRYAELMESEFHVVNTADELLAVAARGTADVILVDTSGRAVEPGTVEAMLGDARLRGASPSARRVEVMLCTPAALRVQDAERISRAFSSTEPTSLCVTKLDETDVPSALLHAPLATRQLPLSTLCFGQRVPEDIATATIEEIVARLVPASGSQEAPGGHCAEERAPRRSSSQEQGKGR